MKQRNYVQPEELAALRNMSLAAALESVGVYFKRDPSYRPRENGSSQRWHVTTDHRVIELIVTGAKWFDTQIGVGGGGSIDLVVHVKQVGFRQAVRLLQGR
jgi:hypothetical protein